MDLPQLNSRDMLVLKNLRKGNPQAFYSNQTKFFIDEMTLYIKDKRVWRLSIMGETRGGKSEIGQTVALTYVQIFNSFFNKGHFDNEDVFTEGYFKPQEIDLGVDEINNDVHYVRANQSDYIYFLRELHSSKRMRFGQIYIIDENKDSIGGIGSFSELIDLKNLNNIIAKFMQCEIWIQPLELETKNAPYGLYAYKKDLKNKVNWCLLYKIQRSAIGGVEYIFLGWVKVPLHNDKTLRKLYNEKKNRWIKDEIDGSSDNRLSERKLIAQKLSEDEFFSKRTVTGKTFKRSKSQQITILETWIIEKKTQNWNQLERVMIVEEARMLADMRYEKDEREKDGTD